LIIIAVTTMEFNWYREGSTFGTGHISIVVGHVACEESNPNSIEPLRACEKPDPGSKFANVEGSVLSGVFPDW
jgi:hypothetical protein